MSENTINWDKVMDDNEIDEFELAEYRKQRQRMALMEARIRQEEMAAGANRFMHDSWTEALQSEGLTPEQYNELAGMDPWSTEKEIKAAMRHFVRSVKTRRGQKPDQPPQ